jgi:release factor glutamine methyltransferase
LKDWKVLPLLERAAQFLEGKSSDSPRLDAELLLSEVLGLRRIDLYLQYDKTVTEEEVSRFRELTKRRAQGCPCAYILGRKEFYSLSFQVGTGVMIPRPETEHLIMEVLDACAREKLTRVLIADIGTGCANIAVAIAKNLPDASIKATDISPEALQFAQLNVANHNLQDRIELLRGDFLEPLRVSSVREKLDFVVSNPPYISEKEFEKLPAGIKDYEPGIAFLAGKDGLDAYRVIVSQSADFLKVGGHLVLELGAGVSEKVKTLVEESGHYSDIVIRKDFCAIDRVLHTLRK